jgi:ribonuclease E
MLDSERHDTGSSSDGSGSDGPSGLTEAPAAKAAPRKRTTRRRTAKPAADSAPPEATEATAAAAPEAAAPGAAADTPAAAPSGRARSGRAPKPAGDQADGGAGDQADGGAGDQADGGAGDQADGGTGDQADGGTATRRPARRTRRSASRATASSKKGAAGAADAGAADAGAATAPSEAGSATGQAPGAGRATGAPATSAPAADRPAADHPAADHPAAGSAPGQTSPVVAPFAAPFSRPAAPFTGAAAPATGPPPAPAQTEPPGVPAATFQPPQVIFQPPAKTSPAPPAAVPARPAEDQAAPDDQAEPGDGEAEGTGRRRRRRGSRSRGRGAETDGGQDAAAADGAQAAEEADAGAGTRQDAGARQGAAPASEQDAGTAGEDGEEEEAAGGGSRRRRRKRRRGSAADADQAGPDDPPNTVVHVRPARSGSEESGDGVQVVRGSTRLEAKRQRRREGRDSGRRRPPVITESEFLARREAVDRVMVVRQRGERTQIAVLEDKVLVEHYVDRGGHQSLVGNVYLGKVQNVLPSMEAAFVDIGKGRNAVLYAGEVNFDASGLEGESKRIELALKSGQSVLVQVTKDPVGHKGARLTSQASLPGRYLVYVPGGSMMGISRKLPDTERTRLKQILKQVMPESAGVIVRTAAEGASEEELAHDVARLSAQWESIERKAKSASPPELLYSEPDLTIRVVRDIFNEDFTKLVVSGDQGWDLVDEYVRYVAPHLTDRLEHWQSDEDAFAHYRVDEHLARALERKVWLPSGGSLVIDNTEAMTVVDVNTGKFTGQGGNLEETVTRNNLEAAEEIVRQLRLRDVGGIIVIDFIDMVLESNRELVLRRLLECLARDRTKHQVAEVTSLGLVQMTRKRVGSGLLEAFSETCECCNGRGLLISLDGVEHQHQHQHRARPEGVAAKDGKNGKASRDGKGREGRRQRQGKADKDGADVGAKAGEKPAADRTAETSAASTVAENTAAADAAAAGTVASGPGDAAPASEGDAAAPGQPDAATGQGAGQDGAEAVGNGAAGQSFGGRRRRRAATREPGPPDAAVSTDGQAASEASAAAGV